MNTKTKQQKNNIKPPVVTMLGHVDHGKTSILDVIRDTKIQEGEAGGITQNVRAHQVNFKDKKGNEQKITFIDTPGHEAFSQMRSRGASVTDIVVLVVAANDGVQPQTVEAVEFAKESEVPIIVALNKMDLESIDKAKIKRELANIGVQAEDLGGDTIFVETSAEKKEGINELLETILLISEMNQIKEEELKDGKAKATVLESTIDKSIGTVSLCLVNAGEIKVDDYILVGENVNKVRAIQNEFKQLQDKAVVSDAVWVSGISEELPIGEVIYFYDNPDDLKESLRKYKESQNESETKKEETELTSELLSDLLSSRNEGTDYPELNIILKSQNQGTLEVVMEEMEKINIKGVGMNIISADCGDINEDDILKAKDVNGIVIGFKSSINKKTKKIAKLEKVLVQNYEIIYNLLDELEEVLESFIEPEEEEVEVARALVKKIFTLSDGKKVAGCMVEKGTVVKGYTAFVMRKENGNNLRVGDGKIVSLKHGKEEVHEAIKGAECGIMLEPQVDIEKKDIIVCFKIQKSK